MILSGKADDADGLTPFKEENAAWRNQTMCIFKSFSCYKVVGAIINRLRIYGDFSGDSCRSHSRITR